MKQTPFPHFTDEKPIVLIPGRNGGWTLSQTNEQTKTLSVYESTEDMLEGLMQLLDT